MVNHVSAFSGVSSNDLMVILDSVFFIIITNSLVNTHIFYLNYNILMLNYLFI